MKGVASPIQRLHFKPYFWCGVIQHYNTGISPVNSGVERLFIRMFTSLFEERQQTLKSFTTPKFRKCLSDLPPPVQKKAQETYKKWLGDPSSVDFRQLQGKKNVWRVSICGGDWRAMGLVKGDTINWFWIGSHNEYEKLIRAL